MCALRLLFWSHSQFDPIDLLVVVICACTDLFPQCLGAFPRTCVRTHQRYFLPGSSSNLQTCNTLLLHLNPQISQYWVILYHLNVLAKKSFIVQAQIGLSNFSSSPYRCLEVAVISLFNQNILFLLRSNIRGLTQHHFCCLLRSFQCRERSFSCF